MKTASPELTAHIAQEATTLTALWEIRRRDGVIIYLTELDINVEFEGNTYLAASGFSKSAIVSEEGLETQSVDIDTVITAGAIRREDVVRQLYNFAEVRISFINWADPSQGVIKMRRGFFGEVLIGAADRLQTEIESLTSRLNNTSLVERTSATCRAVLGDERCTIPINVPEILRETAYEVGDFVQIAFAPGTTSEVFGNRIFEVTSAGTTAPTQPTVNPMVGATTIDGSVEFTAREAFTRFGSIQAPSDRSTFTISVDEPRAFADATYFALGRINFESGPLVGRSAEIRTWDAANSTITIFEPFRDAPNPGDVFTISPGCDRSRETCVFKFVIPNSTNFSNGNILNFRGEPDIPGQDFVFTVPDAQ